ncbi:unnamed protein product [Adineta steineri]|uniref:Uncharacterized protein n=1 Tax=Adineta steineri TaxID=433720 RepID=A0A818H9V4_9BILA|nr:unnamed protein product [Adineta steineri]
MKPWYTSVIYGIIHTPDLIFPVSSISGLPLNSTPREAFVTFCNNNPKYLALLTNVFDSIHSFSTHPIIVYGIDTDLNIDSKKYPRVIQRRLSQKDCGNSIYFCKFYVIVHSQVDYGVYLEADTLRAHNLMRQNNFLGANFDETDLNILLWQARANHTLL